MSDCPQRLDQFQDDDRDRERSAAYLASPEGIRAKQLEREASDLALKGVPNGSDSTNAGS